MIQPIHKLRLMCSECRNQLPPQLPDCLHSLKVQRQEYVMLAGECWLLVLSLMRW